jgi:hypothetical protein
LSYIGNTIRNVWTDYVDWIYLACVGSFVFFYALELIERYDTLKALSLSSP